MTTHGHTANGKLSPEYRSWSNMWQRCTNPKNNRYHLYGGAGVLICERWQIFELFLQDMGPRPSREHSIERLDNDADYSPDNCVWATRQEQGRNKSNNRRVEINGIEQCVVQWAEQAGISQKLIHARLRRGERGAALLRPKEPRASRRGRTDTEVEVKR